MWLWHKKWIWKQEVLDKWLYLDRLLELSYSTAQVVFQNPPPPPPDRTGGVDFLAHCGSSWYPTPIPTTTDFSTTAFPPSSLRKTTHLSVELRGGQKFIMASSQWKISDVRMIDSSEFFRVCMGRKSEPLFCLRIIQLICRWINTEIFLPEIKNKKQQKQKKQKRINE